MQDRPDRVSPNTPRSIQHSICQLEFGDIGPSANSAGQEDDELTEVSGLAPNSKTPARRLHHALTFWHSFITSPASDGSHSVDLDARSIYLEKIGCILLSHASRMGRPASFLARLWHRLGVAPVYSVSIHRLEKYFNPGERVRRKTTGDTQSNPH